MDSRTKYPLGILLFSILLFCVLYFVLDTKPQDQKLLEKSRAANFESTNIQILKKEANNDLSLEVKQYLEALELKFHQEQDSIAKDSLKEVLSSQWFKAGQPAIAGYYAEEIAKVKNDAESWGITGSTFYYGIQNEKEDKVKQYCKSRAVKAFDNAISLNPDNIDYKINKSLIFVEMPPEDNPMTGILQLVKLNRDFPGTPKVLNQLGRLALQTNQIDKAIERLNQAYEVEPNNKTTVCLLAEAYTKKNETSLVEKFVSKCTELINNK